MLGIVMEKDYRTVFNLACYPFANTVGGGVVLPVKAVNIRYKSKEFFTKSLKRLLLQILSIYVIIANGIR